MPSKALVKFINVTKIEAFAPYAISVRFSDGTHGIHDCTALVHKNGPMVDPLREPAYFARVFLDTGAPTWPNSFDMCPDWLQMEMEGAGELKQSEET